METIPEDIKLKEFWKYLPYESIIYLCQVNREFSSICQDNLMWCYLLYRDFDVIYVEVTAQNRYLSYKCTLAHFSNFYPIITKHALKSLVDLVPVSKWSKFNEAIKSHKSQYGFLKILTYNDLVGVSYVDVNCEYILEESERKLFKEDDPHLIYHNFNQMVQELNEHNCSQLDAFISRSSLVFINNKLVLINYDYELLQQFGYNINLVLLELYREQEAEVSNSLFALLK